VKVNDFVKSHEEKLIKSKGVSKEKRKLGDGGWGFISLGNLHSSS
jgi:hypothetical protein